MDDNIFCPKCRQPVGLTDFFCRYCGKNLRPLPLPTSLGAQLWLYTKALLLPPLGLIWGARYLRQPDPASKFVGLFAIFVTVAEIYVVGLELVSLASAFNSDTSGMYSQIRVLMGN
jgi:hypothetical protein